MRINKLILIAFIAVLAVANTASAQVSFGSGEKIVSAKAYLTVDKLRPGDSFRVAVRATVKSGYHVSAAAKGSLYPAKLKLTAPKSIRFSAPVFPKAKQIGSPGDSATKIPVYEGAFTVTARGRVAPDAKPGPVTITATLDTQACKGGQCFAPELTKSTIKTQIVKRGTPVKKANPSVFGAGTTSGGGLEGRLARAPLALRLLMLYALGLVLAFTPCVYPMVPVTVGYFSTQGQSRTRRVVLLASAYVLGLALTYSILGAVAAATGGIFGSAMQSTPVLVGIAVLLVGLALSMFGLYELQPPSFIQSRSSGRSGVAGALVMGLVFGVVCAPCVGPVVLGLMAFVANLGNPVMGFGLFFALALGIGTPLFALAAFSAKMPVPGMWMVAVKKAAGFLMLGAAAYFLTPILPETIARYAVPAVLMAGGLYLGFFEKSIRQSRVTSSLGKATGTAALIAAVVLATPHMKADSLKWRPYSPAAVAAATRAGSPVMIDFTAKWCMACRELERGPFSDARVARAAAQFAQFRMDGTNARDPKVIAAAKRYDVKGFPAVVFIDRSGKEAKSARVVEYIGAQEMVKRIRSVR